MVQRRRGGAAVLPLLLAAALVAACGDDAGGTASGTGGASGTGSGTGVDTGSGAGVDTGSGAGGGETEAVGEALVALLNVEDEIFEVEIEGSPFAFLPMNLGSGVVFVAPIFDCGAGLGTCIELFREGFTEPTELAVDDGGTVVHVFAGAPGEDGDATSNDVLPEPGIEETVVVVRDYLVGPELVLSAPSGTLNPLGVGIATVGAGQEIAFVQEDDSITLTDIVLEEGRKYAIATDVSTTGGIELAVCPLEDGEDCIAWAYGGG